MKTIKKNGGKKLSENLKEIVEEISKNDNVLIVGHILPDGDDVSSLVSMTLGLEKLGKNVTAVIDDEIPEYLLQFPWVKSKIKKFEDVEKIIYKNFDIMVILDCSSPDRIGKFEKYLNAFHVLLIDHHVTNTHFGNLNWVDPTMASTAQMVYRILTSLNVEYDKELATMNLLGIATDTGFFKYQNADVLVFKDVTELIEKGANISDISNTILDNIPLEQIYLYKDVISNLKLALNGQIAYSLLSLDMLSKYNVLPKDSPSFVENLRSIRGVEIAIVFQEYEKGSYHVSLRSKKWADVSKIALNYGGGGHPRAAGFSIETNDIKQTMEEIVYYISKTIGNPSRNLAYQ